MFRKSFGSSSGAAGPAASSGTTRRLGLLVVALLAAACGGGGGDDPYHIYPMFVDTDVVVTDLDGDGRSDVLTIAGYWTGSTRSEGRLTVYRQTTPGGFTSESYTFGTYPWRMTVADVDGDGAPDVAIVDVGRTDQPQPTRIWLFKQDAAQRGRLLAPQVLIEAGLFDSMAIADLNGDGAPDIALADNLVSPGANGVTVLYQNRAARGTFAAPVVVPLPGRAAAVAIGDVDGDGRADLVVHTITGPFGALPPQPSVLSLLHQRADGTLNPAVTLAPRNGLNSDRLEVRDADGDGRADIVHHETPCCGSSAYLTMLLQGPIGTFRDVATPLAGPSSEHVAFGDLDGDGRVDAAGVRVPDAQISLLRQEAGGTFRTNGATATMSTPMGAIATGDVDGDGRTDLVAYGADNRAWVLLQVPGQPGTFGSPRLLP